MKIKQLQDLRKKEINDLIVLITQKRSELLKLEVKVLGGQEKNVKLIKNLKKDIVQILTLKSEKEKSL